MIAVLLLAPTPVARAGLRALLAEAGDAGLVVVAEVADSEALERQFAVGRPDCLVVEPPSTDERLLTTLARLMDQWPGLAVVWLGLAGVEPSQEALRAGVRAYLRPAVTGPELVAAIHAVHLGLMVLDPGVTGPLVDRLTDRSTTLLLPVDSAPALTSREREVLELLAEGQTNRAIALRLGISEHTAKFHVGAVLAKLGAASRAEAVALAVRSGRLSV